MRAGGSAERPATFFDGPEDFRAWLEEHHGSATEIWMGLNKKHVQPRGLTWDQAVLEALCFGWIDSQVQRIDADTVRQRWTPRKSTSVWSTVNLAHVERLTAAGLMRPAGIAAWEKRRPDRSGIYAYESGQTSLPDGYASQLAADPAATAFWEAGRASYRRIAITWVTSAKTAATNDKRMAQLVAACAAGELIPSQRYGAPPAWQVRASAAAKAARTPPHG